MTNDAVFADHPDSPYAAIVDRTGRIADVADWHFSMVTPSFCEWFAEQDYTHDLAYIVSNIVCGDDGDKAEARRLCVRIQTDWQEFVASCNDYDSWPLARQLYREVRR